jgi:RNA polymerase-binding transcription factor DksA
MPAKSKVATGSTIQVSIQIEMLNSMVIRQQQFINNLENALIRIQNKTYGICTVTGQLIDKKRLKLVLMQPNQS